MNTLQTRILPVALVAVAVFLSSCSTVPVTGRSQLNIIPASTMQSMSYQQYGEFLQTHQVSRDQSKIQMVQRVGANIKNAVELYFKQKGLSDQLNGYRWEFNLVESPEVNAWCMPGGKVVVYSGILPITQTETGLAVVMGHEIAHAIAEHGSERMSQGLITQLGGMALNEALSSKPEQTRALYMSAFGLGAQVGVLLPFSRLHESEADKLGLIFMAMAGYNPNEAVTFWQRMAANKGGQAPPEFLSTHPSDATRIQDLKAALPEAMKYYKK
ncbi:MAG: M48 family metallopeptidase [Bacteroidota bacterium]